MSESAEDPKIVVVDDDPEILKLITMLLRRIGATTNAFHSGQEALDYLAENTPDLIILDLMMPEVDGFDVLRHVRRQIRFNRVPVLILSAKTDPNSIREGLELGADGYVTKPYIANTLIDRVRLLLDSERQVKPQDSPGAG
ncbi:MAG: response regulator [Anaerolineae bacterium]|nr:response regulator [Anaerolineae bacterium]